MAKIKLLNGVEVDLSLDELEELTRRISKNSGVTEPLQTGKVSDTWRWNDEAVKEVADGCYGKSEKLLRAFVQHGRELKYKDLCRYTSMRGLHLVGPLSAIRKRVKKAIGHDNAKLILKRWVIPGNRDERIYSIHEDAYDALKAAFEKS
jgi:hypothetical protein